HVVDGLLRLVPVPLEVRQLVHEALHSASGASHSLYAFSFRGICRNRLQMRVSSPLLYQKYAGLTRIFILKTSSHKGCAHFRMSLFLLNAQSIQQPVQFTISDGHCTSRWL